MQKSSEDHTLRELLTNYKNSRTPLTEQYLKLLFEYLDIQQAKPELRRECSPCPKCGEPEHGKTKCKFAHKVREVVA